MNKSDTALNLSRRSFIGGTAAAALTWPFIGRGSSLSSSKQPNILFIGCDQLFWGALSAYGCKWVNTPNLDWLVSHGHSFRQSYCTDPVCGPSRSSWFTGRMPSETGVVSNGRYTDPSIRNMGETLRDAGYDTFYCGKHHIPFGYPTRLKGFSVLPSGGGEGDVNDEDVSRVCEAFLKNRKPNGTPWMLSVQFLEPHDICMWSIEPKRFLPKELPFKEIADRLPPLPENLRSNPDAPAYLKNFHLENYTDEQWRYYTWIYYRMVEMLDANVGRILAAVEQSGQSDNTLIVFTADHGESLGHHSRTTKGTPYEESSKVPLIFVLPGQVQENVQDRTHLASGLDLMPTFCDYAGIEPPPHQRGFSLRPVLENRVTDWRKFVAIESNVTGRTICSLRYKYTKYTDDPVEQLLDLQSDPQETKNEYRNPAYVAVMEEYRHLLAQWESKLITREPTQDIGYFERPDSPVY